MSGWKTDIAVLTTKFTGSVCFARVFYKRHPLSAVIKKQEKKKLFLFMYTIPHAKTHVQKPLPNDKFLDRLFYKRHPLLAVNQETEKKKLFLFMYTIPHAETHCYG